MLRCFSGVCLQTIPVLERILSQRTHLRKVRRAFIQGLDSHYIRICTLGAEAIAEADSMPATEIGDWLIDEIELAFMEESGLPQLIEAG